MLRIFITKLHMMPSNNIKHKTQKQKAQVTAAQCHHNNHPVYADKSGNICIRINAKPGARQSAVTGIDSDGVGIQIAAPALEGEANIELIKYLSEILDMKKSEFCLDKGARSRNKIVQITKPDTTPEAITELLRKAFG